MRSNYYDKCDRAYYVCNIVRHAAKFSYFNHFRTNFITVHSPQRRKMICRPAAAVIETPASGGQPPAQTLKTQYSSPLLSLGSVCPQVLMAKSTPQFKPWMVAQPRGPLFRPTCTRTVNTSTVKDSSFQVEF